MTDIVRCYFPSLANGTQVKPQRLYFNRIPVENETVYVDGKRFRVQEVIHNPGEERGQPRTEIRLR